MSYAALMTRSSLVLGQYSTAEPAKDSILCKSKKLFESRKQCPDHHTTITIVDC